jgi:hypothetical protein
VTLSQPHCAMTSAEKPDGIASHPLTLALPASMRALSFVGIRAFLLNLIAGGKLGMDRRTVNAGGNLQSLDVDQRRNGAGDVEFPNEPRNADHHEPQATQHAS